MTRKHIFPNVLRNLTNRTKNKGAILVDSLVAFMIFSLGAFAIFTGTKTITTRIAKIKENELYIEQVRDEIEVLLTTLSIQDDDIE